MEGRARQLADDFGKAHVIALGAVDARADSRAAHSQVAEEIDALDQHIPVTLDHAGPAAKFLAQRQGRRILQVGPANLDDVLEGFLFDPECLINGFHGREQFLFDEHDADHMQACREGIVRALGMIDVVIGMDIQVLALGF